MTIAATFLSTEGVVFGADSTASVPVPISDGHETKGSLNTKRLLAGWNEDILEQIILDFMGF